MMRGEGKRSIAAWKAVALAIVLCCAFACPVGLAAADSSMRVDGASLKAATGTPLQPQSVVTTQQAQGDISWYKGSSPYTVSNINQLIGLSYLVNTGKDSFKGKVVQMPATVGTLAFLGTSITPIGTSAHPFEGTFDGKGWTISNLTLDRGGSLSNVGLFGYAGASATLKNVRLAGGTVSVSNSTAGKKISNIGAIAGYLGGSLQDCYGSVSVSVTNNGAVPGKKGTVAADMTIILGVGGLVGTLGGNMTGCTNAGTVSINSSSNVTDDVPYIAGYVGGLAGLQGSTSSDASRSLVTKNCSNAGALVFNVSGSGGVDRFGQQMYSKTAMVGGIVGYSMASISDCKNTAAIQTGFVKDGVTQSGWGGSTVGGIVGSLRGPEISESASATGVVGSDETDPGYTVWTESEGKTKPVRLSVTRCSNTGSVTGLASVGGIAGGTGAFTEVIGCSNTALIEGTRWNKPCPAGIVGISNGDIGYCYNQGRCFSTTGGGYYASGITAILSTYNTTGTPSNLVIDAPELYSCYVTGNIGGENPGYRTAVLAGENDGFIHDNCFLPDLTVDKESDKDIYGDGNMHSRLVTAGENRGTLANNHELSANDMKSSMSASYLNKPYAQKSDWSLYYAPLAGKFPILNWQGKTTSSPKALSSVVTGATLVENPAYSAAYAPVPSVTLASSGVKLYQDADYKVVANPNAKAVGGIYTATIEGINGYSGVLATTVSYSVAKASIDTCTVTAETAIFSWKRQEPKSVTVRDVAGNVVNPNEYTWRTLANADGSTKAVNEKYYDYINCHGEGYKYDIEVTAKPTSAYYSGKTTQAAFKISWASLMYAPENDGRTDIPESAKLGNVVFGGQEWSIAKALKTKGYVKIKYTGKEIKPTFKSVTYLGKSMRNGTGKPYYYEPLKYDYMYVYGNPNPEPGKEEDNQCINVTGSKEAQLGCVTVRFTSGGNFDNYTNVFYEITPASIKRDVKVSGISKSYAYTGKAVKVSPKLTYNGMTLKEGTDYKLSYTNNRKAGKATVTITGKGNYSGSVSKKFTIKKASLAKASVKVAAQSYTGKTIAPKLTVKMNKKTLKQGTDFTISVKNSKKKSVSLRKLKAAGTYKLTVKGKGAYTGSTTTTFKIAKAKNTMTAKAKAVKLSAKVLKERSIEFKPLTVKKAQGRVTYKMVSGSKSIVVNEKTGKVTAKKGCKKGSYSIRVKVTAKGTANYRALTKTLKLKVTVI